MLAGLHVGCPRNCGSIPNRGKKFIYSAEYPEQHLGPPILLFRYYWGMFSHGYSKWDMMLTT
jgi:hypothetical protein